MNNVTITPSLLDSMIWMSIRYCIGRHTAAAHYHADALKTLMDDNWEILGEERILFYAKDIEEELTFKGVPADDINGVHWAELSKYLKDKYGRI